MGIVVVLAKQIGATLTIEAADPGTRFVLPLGMQGEPPSHALTPPADPPLAV